MFTVYDCAVLLGFIMLLTALPLLLNRKEALKSYYGFIKNKASLQLLGVVTALIGLLVLKTGWHLDITFRGLVALVGWIALVKGIWLTWWTDSAIKFGKHKLDSSGLVTIGTLIGVIVGIWFLWIGLGF